MLGENLIVHMGREIADEEREPALVMLSRE
jgi:hypothetical protein